MSRNVILRVSVSVSDDEQVTAEVQKLDAMYPGRVSVEAPGFTSRGRPAAVAPLGQSPVAKPPVAKKGILARLFGKK